VAHRRELVNLGVPPAVEDPGVASRMPPRDWAIFWAYWGHFYGVHATARGPTGD